MEAAKAVNDHKTYVSAMEKYINYSQEIDSLRKLTMKREIMLRDSVIPAPLLYMDSKHKDNKTSSGTDGYEISWMIISSVLALLLIIYAILYVRLRLKK